MMLDPYPRQQTQAHGCVVTEKRLNHRLRADERRGGRGMMSARATTRRHQIEGIADRGGFSMSIAPSPNNQDESRQTTKPTQPGWDLAEMTISAYNASRPSRSKRSRQHRKRTDLG